MTATLTPCIPRLYAAASLKPRFDAFVQGNEPGIPRLYAAASLKRLERNADGKGLEAYSAALCRGLIEAGSVYRLAPTSANCIPRLYAAASLKQRGLVTYASDSTVFRGSMPRPH